MIRAFRRRFRQWWIERHLVPSAQVEHMTCVLVVAINGKKHAEWKLDCSRVRTHVDTIDALPDVWADGGQFLIDIPINLEVAAS